MGLETLASCTSTRSSAHFLLFSNKAGRPKGTHSHPNSRTNHPCFEGGHFALLKGVFFNTSQSPFQSAVIIQGAVLLVLDAFFS
jgi:hypothetical protein